MDLVQLRMFCHVAEFGSIAKAAEMMERVPSNLTTRLHQLEEELGTDLFIREKQRLRLSPMGHNFLGYARRILALSDEVIHMTKAGEPTGQFTLGAMESTAATILPSLLATYHQRYPEVTVSLTIGSSDDITEQVRIGTLAAGLIDNPLHHAELNGCKAYSDQMVLISSKQHPVIHRAADAKDETLFVFHTQLNLRLRLESWFNQENCAPAKITEVSSYHTLINNVISGAGIAILPSKVLAQLSANTLIQTHALPVDIANHTTWLMWRHEAFNPTIGALKKLIIEQTEQTH